MDTIARIDYLYGNRIVGQAYLEASTVPGYTPSPISMKTDTASGESISYEGQLGQIAGTAEHKPAENPADTDSKEPSKVFFILKIALCAAAVIGLLGGLVFGIITLRERKAERERMIRRQRREQRIKDWGYSTVEFDKIMQEHLRSKNQPKKRGFFGRFRR